MKGLPGCDDLMSSCCGTLYYMGKYFYVCVYFTTKVNGVVFQIVYFLSAVMILHNTYRYMYTCMSTGFNVSNSLLTFHIAIALTQ